MRNMMKAACLTSFAAVLFSASASGRAISNEKVNSILKDTDFYYLDETDALVPYYEMAAERKESILNSPTSIVKSDTFIPGETYVGNAYYISPNGDNENDGLSPETAWKTAHRANWGDVQEGDAVFFERGGVYPIDEERISLVSNVTYSAYGEGSKPVITLAQENSARPECWDLWYEGSAGEKIWRYYIEVGEVGGIVFDDESYAKRIWEWPTPEGWLALDILTMDPAHGITAPEDPCSPMQVTSAGEYRTVEEQLAEDLTYLCRVDISEVSYPMDFDYDYRIGELYLRCDAGNPGELFDDIAVIAQQITEWGEPYGGLLNGQNADGFVIDNLSLKYYIENAIFCFLERGDHAVVQNCTVEWGGNRLHTIDSSEPTNNYYWIGDGIYDLVRNTTIRNNYIRQSGNACTFESNMEQEGSFGTYSATGNLIENCGQGIRTFLIEPYDEGIIDELILQDNIIINTGDSINNACSEESAAIDLGYENVPYAKHIDVSGNILLGSSLAMIRMPGSSCVEIDFHENVIAQSEGKELITEFAYPSSGRIVWHMMEDLK